MKAKCISMITVQLMKGSRPNGLSKDTDQSFTMSKVNVEDAHCTDNSNQTLNSIAVNNFSEAQALLRRISISVNNPDKIKNNLSK